MISAFRIPVLTATTISLLLFAARPVCAEKTREDVREEVRRVLIALKPTTKAEREKLAALIAQLDSDHFKDRLSAQARLMNSTVPEDLLTAAREHASLDVSLRLDEITRVQSERSIELRLQSAMFNIVEGELTGLAKELATALEWRAYTEGNQWFLAIDAFRVMATPDSEDVLRANLHSKDALVRAGAFEGLRKILGGPDVMIPLLLSLKDEPHPLTAVEVADELIAYSHPEALRIYANLIACDDVSVRSRSRDALREITGKVLGGSIFSDKEERLLYSRRWKDWLASDEAASVKLPELSIPIREDATPLFNGNDIADWETDVPGGAIADPFGIGNGNGKPQHHWKFENKVLKSSGDGTTLSREIEAANYTIRVDWRFPEGSKGNPKIAVFSSPPDEKESGVFVDLIPGTSGNIGVWGDKLTMHDKNGSPVSFRKTPDSNSTERRRGWNTLELEVRGNHLTTRINGRTSNSVEIRPAEDGNIDIFPAIPNDRHLVIEPGTDAIEFRNILLQEDD